MSTTKGTAISSTWSPRHKSAPSVDTNASAIAESTISIGQIGKFPEPPSSIPSSPATSTFSASTARQLPIPPRVLRLQPTAPLHPRKLPNPPTSFIRPVDPSHSFIQASSNPQKTSTVPSAHDWHDGASSIDVGTANELLPNTLSTSFITTLLQENKFKRASSATTLALSGISENVCPRMSPSPYVDPAVPASPTAASIPPYDSEILASTVPVMTGEPTSETIAARSKSFGSFRSGDGLLEKRTDLKGLDSSQAHQPRFLSQDPMASRQPFTWSRSHISSPGSARSSKSFLSRISKRLSWRHVRKAKPLPPVPILPHMSLAQQQTYHELEMSSALPDLINRATTLRTMLENGQRPHSSAGSFDVVSMRDAPLHVSHPQDLNGKYGAQMVVQNNSRSSWRQKIQHVYTSRTKTRRKWIIIAGLLVLSVIALGLGLGLGLRKRPQQSSCADGKAGSKCNINSNCICTSTRQCNGLAQAVIDLLPLVNSIFNANFTTALAYSSFWLLEGGSQGNNCVAQAVILDVGNGLDQANFPNRTQWAQTALLWNALKTENLAASLQLQKFVQSLPWNSLDGPDGPVDNVESTSFSVTVSGYTFNFASQKVMQPPGTFVALGQPSNAQIQKVSPTARAALDRIYTYAQASSSQQQTALQKYWTSVLLQRADTLSIFKAVLSASPLMLPFNASSQAIRNMYQSTSSPFPPPLSCFPYLDPGFHQQVSSFETTIFGLPGISNQTGFNTSCYRDRPLYGSLDILQLRLPFRDDVPFVTQQAAVLSRDSNSRVIFSVGKGFSGIFNGTISLTDSQLDPRQYGTVNFLDHVILQYLTSISDINVANALIKFVLDSSTADRRVPPDSSSALYQALTTLPTIEMAIFGDVMPSDFSSIVSPFTINSGALFFGSNDGAALRNWTISTAQLSIVWTQNATSSLVVRDSSLGDNPVTQTWDSVSLALNRGMTNIGLANITNLLMGTQGFSP